MPSLIGCEGDYKRAKFALYARHPRWSFPGRSTMQKHPAPSALSSVWVSLFGLPFLVAGLWMSGLYFSGYAKFWAAKKWEEVPCWIDSAQLEVSHHDSTTYKAAATYHYRYQGRMYESTQVSLGSGSDNIGSFQKRTHEELQRYTNKTGNNPDSFSGAEGKKAFRCFVNPAHPETAVLYRTLRWEMQVFLAIFALSFPAVGAFLIAGGIIGSRNQTRENALRDQHPGQPWKWKTAWTGQSIPADERFRRASLLVYTIWSGLVVLPLVATIALDGFITETKAVVVALIFLGFWSIPAWFSFRRLWQYRAVGRICFEQTDSPAQPGGALNGSIVFEHPLVPKDNAEVRLECQKQVTHRDGGEGTTTTVETVWSRTECLPVDPGAGGAFQCRIRVHFLLPADAPESAFGGSTKIQHGWKLTLRLSEPNVRASFDIPVFRTGSHPAFETDSESQAPSILDTASRDLPALLARRKIQANFDQAGLPVSLVCPPARNLEFVVFLTLFNILWTGISVFLISRNVPLIFRIIWPCSAVLLWALILRNALHKRTVTFRAADVVVTNEFVPLRWVRSFQKSEILDFSSAVHMTSNTHNFYRVQLNTVSGKKETLVDGITESTTADALVARLELWKKSSDGSFEFLSEKPVPR